MATISLSCYLDNLYISSTTSTTTKIYDNQYSKIVQRKMCRLPRRRCLNRNCRGFAQTLDLIPCELRPNCEIEYFQIQRDKQTEEAYCPHCRSIGRFPGARVERQAESAGVGERRGAVDREYPPESDNLFGKSSLGNSQYSRHAEFVSSSYEMIDSPSKEDPFTNSREGRLDRNFVPSYHYADGNSLPTSLPVSKSTNVLPQQEYQQLETLSLTLSEEIDAFNATVNAYQQPRTPSSTLSEEIDLFNATFNALAMPTLIIPSPPRDYYTGPGAMALSDLPNSPPISPGFSNQPAPNHSPLSRETRRHPSFPSLRALITR